MHFLVYFHLKSFILVKNGYNEISSEGERKMFGKEKSTWEELSGIFTAQEIYQQPATWAKTIAQIKNEKEALKKFMEPVLSDPDCDIVFTGAGTSEYFRPCGDYPERGSLSGTYGGKGLRQPRPHHAGSLLHHGILQRPPRQQPVHTLHQGHQPHDLQLAQPA